MSRLNPRPSRFTQALTLPSAGMWGGADQDHVWVIPRGGGGLHEKERGLELNPPIPKCCRPAPPILVFDQAGNLVRSWGGPGPGYEWPEGAHGVHVDYKGNVWLGGNGKGDAQVLKFTKEGKFLMQLGRYGKNAGSNDLENFGRVAKIWVDPKTNEAYIADGYLNKRVAVVDADTGKMKRYWGAYGNKPSDAPLGNYDPKAPPAQQFRNPVHCVERSNDGLVYVCDRQGDRVQVFQPDGKFVKEGFYAKETLASVSAWDITFSKDREQRFMFLADGQNEKGRIILRDTLEEISNFGDGGRRRRHARAHHGAEARRDLGPTDRGREPSRRERPYRRRLRREVRARRAYAPHELDGVAHRKEREPVRAGVARLGLGLYRHREPGRRGGGHPGADRARESEPGEAQLRFFGHGRRLASLGGAFQGDCGPGSAPRACQRHRAR